MFKIREAASVLLLVVIASACNLPWGPAVIEDTVPDPAVATERLGLTQLLTSSITSTLTSETPRVSVSMDTNCRTGPGTVYPALGVLTVAQTAEVVGRSASSDNWIIKLPSNPAVTCWLWGYYATVTGDTASLTVYTPPPTPTPVVSFTLSYLSTSHCDSAYFCRFQIANTGSVTWKSYRVVIYDSTTSTTKTFAFNTFRDVVGCGAPTEILEDLEPGEAGVAGNYGEGILLSNPAGHSLTATLTLFSEDNLAGQSVVNSISFTP